MGIVASAASVLCEACTCAVFTLSCLCKGTGEVSTKTAKLLYFLMLALSTILAACLYNWGDRIKSAADFFSFKDGCDGSLSDKCFGTQAVFRVSFSTAAFFLVTLVCSGSRQFHLGLWGLKAIVYLVLVVGGFFIPYDFFGGYAEASLIISIFFLVMQVIILIDFAYRCQEWLFGKIEKKDEELSEEYEEVGLCQNCWSITYLVTVFLLIAAVFATLIGLFAYSHASSSNCRSNNTFLSLTLIFGLVYCALSASSWVGKGLLTPSIVFTYCTWLCWSAIASNTDSSCNPVSNGSTTESQIFAVVVTAITLIYTCYSSASSFPGLFAAEPEPEQGSSDGMKQSLLSSSSSSKTGEAKEVQYDPEDPLAAASKKAEDEEDAEDRAEAMIRAEAARDADPPKQTFWAFHLIMLAASFYMCMLLTNWVVSAKKPETHDNSMWVKISSQWVCTALYVWTLLAEKACPGRSFS